MLNEITVLLTGAGAPGAPGIIKCLRKNGERNIRIVGVDMNENATGRKLVDAFYKVPAGKDPAFLPCILDICKKESVQVVMPLVTRELEKFADAVPLFEEHGIKVAVTSAESLKTANNKGALLKRMQDERMPTPEFYLAKNSSEVDEAIQKLNYPEKSVVVKPVVGNGSRGTRILNAGISRYEQFFDNKPNPYFISRDELVSILTEKDEIPEMMVMEFLPGTEYSIDILANCGNIAYTVCRKGLNVVSSIMVDSVIETNSYITQLCEKVVKLLQLDGNIGFDMKENSAGIPCVMEINPRLTAGVVACAAAGVNLPYLRIKQLLGETLSQVKAVEGCMMQRRYGEVFFSPDGNEIEW